MLSINSKQGLDTLLSNNLINNLLHTTISDILIKLGYDNSVGLPNDCPFLILTSEDDIRKDFAKYNLPESVEGLLNKHSFNGNKETVWEFCNQYTFNGDEWVSRGSSINASNVIYDNTNSNLNLIMLIVYYVNIVNLPFIQFFHNKVLNIF
jgi:hypothetical protein